MDKQTLIEQLQLEPHLEGGYFRRTYASGMTLEAEPGKPRPSLSSIYYLLTDDSPIGYFHCNRSDILHYWHSGSALRYLLISPAGEFTSFVLGPDLQAGEQLQACVPGGYWKATVLEQGEYGLLSEAVSPGFDYADMTLANRVQMQKDFPALFANPSLSISTYCKQ